MEQTRTIIIEGNISPLERARKIAELKGWGPLSAEEKKELDEAVRMVTNLN